VVLPRLQVQSRTDINRDVMTLMSKLLSPHPGRIKCLVWDLDHTLWDGVLAEGDMPQLRPGVRTLLSTLDERGILHSIASKNDPTQALIRLRELQLDHYFLAPQISWGTKSEALARIAKELGIGIDSLAFLDDQPYERDEVAFSHPEVLCLDAGQIDTLAAMPEFTPRFITDESARRRQMYREDAQRREIEASFAGPKEEFLASLDMVFTVTHADEHDLQRLEELTARTNQLNTTGRVYSYEELDCFRRSPGHVLLAAALDDRYGSYGKIGMALMEIGSEVWNIKLLLMSCRVISRGLGSGLLIHIMRAARAHGVVLRSEIIPTERNRLMYATYRLAGFTKVNCIDGVEILQAELARTTALPTYIELRCDCETVI